MVKLTASSLLRWQSSHPASPLHFALLPAFYPLPSRSHRDLWDENVLDIRRVQPASQAGGRLHKHTEWCLHAYRSRFPRPMAAREYQYARRVWHRPSDGGCYVLCRGLALPDAGVVCCSISELFPHFVVFTLCCDHAMPGCMHRMHSSCFRLPFLCLSPSF
jgi:hypothetical protein